MVATAAEVLVTELPKFEIVCASFGELNCSGSETFFITAGGSL